MWNLKKKLCRQSDSKVEIEKHLEKKCRDTKMERGWGELGDWD